MTEIRCIYESEPAFPATDQHPDAVRHQVAGRWVDAIGGVPTEAEILAVLAPVPVPAAVGLWQAKAALAAAGHLAAADAAVAASGNTPLQLAWEYATEVHRASPAIAAIGAALGLTQGQIDDLFLAAAALTV